MGLFSITEAMVAWLSSLGYRASTIPPKDAPDNPSRFVTVEKTGGDVRNLVEHSTIAIQAWARTDAQAEEMANAIKGALLLGERPARIHSVFVDSGPYRFYDKETRTPRYQTLYSITSQLLED